MKSLRVSLAFAAALLMAPAFAQDAAQEQAPAAASQAPKVTDTKGIGDWTVRCFSVKSPMPCEMAEVRVAKKTGQRVLGVMLAYMPANDAHMIQVSVPLGVAFANGLVINTDTYKSGVLKFRRCDQGGCYVEAAVGGDVVSALGKATDAKVHIVSVDGKPFDFPFSLNGFNEAHAAMVDLAKQKATRPAEAAPAAP